MPQDIKDGGPAFPCVSGPHMDENRKIVYPVQYGMSLRDWFAGMALQGMLSNIGFMKDDNGNSNNTLDNYARAAFLQADAMLKARGE